MFVTTAGVKVGAKFDRQDSWFPVEGQPSDPFNHNFKLAIEIYSTAPCTIPARTSFVAIQWKGKLHLLAINKEPIKLPFRTSITWHGNPPTIAQLLRYLGEEVPSETTSYSYEWVLGFIIDEYGRINPNGDRVGIADRWPTNLLVIIKGWPVDKILAAAGLGAMVMGMLALASNSGSIRPYVYQYGLAAKQFVTQRVAPSMARTGAKVAYGIGRRLEQYGGGT